MKKILFLVALLLLAACSSEPPDYTIVEQDNPEGQKATARVYTDASSEEDLKAIVNELKNDEFFGATSIHVYIHEEPKEDEEFGALIATGKYANTSQGSAQVGVEETGKVYIEEE